MKPNGKYFVVRAFVFALFAVAMVSALGNAETVSGKFKLPSETRWGMILLAPGEYEFTFDSDASGRIVRVQSTDSGWSAMVMAAALSDAMAKHGSGLELAKSEGGRYVKRLYVGDLGLALDFSAPKPGREARLTKFKPATTAASASGSN
jgi:hypothetical protein